ncbi:MAG: uroporphyrinogen-III synthase [Proteobacteria bacterium]|nr:uroporphyrinogen-III synthase [Pseudomonadota bacterium]
MGLAAEGWPLFAVEPVTWEAPDPADIDALLLGSANALRQAGPALAAYGGKPAYAVGAATAAAARAAGLAVVGEGSGGLQALLAQLRPGHHRLLRLAGEERVMLDLPPGIAMAERVVYRVTPQPLPPALATRLAGGAVVLLHSAEAARHFVAEVGRLGCPRHAIALAAIGPRVSAVAGAGWARVAEAARPDDASLLALAAQLCQNLAPQEP